MGDFIFDNLGWVIVFLIGLVFVGFIATVQEQERNRLVFMEGCLQDKKQYECDVLWGQTREAQATKEMGQAIAIGAAAGVVAGSRR